MPIIQIKNFLQVIFIVGFFNITNDLLSYFIFSPDESRLLSAFVISFLLAVPALFIKRGLKIYLLLIYLMTILPSVIYLLHLLLYRSPIFSDTYFIVYTTNLEEIGEFMMLNFRWWTFIGIIIYCAVPLAAMYYLDTKRVSFALKEKLILLSSVGIFTLTILFILNFNFAVIRYNNYYVDVYSSYFDFRKETNAFNIYYKKRKDSVKNIAVVDRNDSLCPTYVIIIGESTNKYHLSLYGYARNTNPELSKKEILLYQHVISPNVQTIPCLKQILTFADRTDSASFYTKPSIIELFNAAGYETYWISNQKPLGLYDTPVAALAGECRHVSYKNQSLFHLKNNFDEILLPEVDKVLKTEKKKKVLFVHLMGTHEDYTYRYPKRFERFKDSAGIRSKLPHLSEKQITIINTYDNAVLYNDSIVSAIIDMTESETAYSYVLYFSDHGDEVYEERDFFGHNLANASSYQYDIPFMLWLSRDYRKEMKQLPNNLEKHYCTDEVIHSILDLSGLQTQYYDPTRSIFSHAFIERAETSKVY